MLKDDFALTLFASFLLLHVKTTSQGPADLRRKPLSVHAMPEHSAGDPLHHSHAHQQDGQAAHIPRRLDLDIGPLPDLRWDSRGPAEKSSKQSRNFYVGGKITPKLGSDLLESTDRSVYRRRGRSVDTAEKLSINKSKTQKISSASLKRRAGSLQGQKRPKTRNGLKLAKIIESREKPKGFGGRSEEIASLSLRRRYTVSPLLKLHQSFENMNTSATAKVQQNSRENTPASPHPNSWSSKNDSRQRGSLTHLFTRLPSKHKNNNQVRLNPTPASYSNWTKLTGSFVEPRLRTTQGNVTKASLPDSFMDLLLGPGEHIKSTVKRDTGLITVSVQSIVPVLQFVFLPLLMRLTLK